MLTIASLLSIVINEIVEEEKEIAWVEGFGIFLAVLVVLTVTSVNDYSKEQKFIKLNQSAEGEKKVSPPSSRVDSFPSSWDYDVETSAGAGGRRYRED